MKCVVINDGNIRRGRRNNFKHFRFLAASATTWLGALAKLAWFRTAIGSIDALRLDRISDLRKVGASYICRARSAAHRRGMLGSR
jgi:hypothetical protein